MNQRLDFQSAAPHVLRPLYEMGKALAESTLEPTLQYLVTLRASQINGCAFCIALHTRELASVGESGDRVFGLPAWREAPWYTDRERAALAWTEALTGVCGHHPDDALFERVKAYFSDREMAELSLAIAAINAWNIFNIGFGTPPDRAEAVFQMLHPAAAATN